MLISFDFDNTIGMLHWNALEADYERDDYGEHIQTPNLKIMQKIYDYIQDGHKVIIVTSRFSRWKQDVVDKLANWNIPITEIYCTDGAWKANTLKRLKADMHYDDDMDELRRLRNTNVKGILVKPLK